MKKRMIAIAAVIAVAATMFAGCGNKQAMEETTETAAVVSEAAEEQIEVSEEQPEADEEVEEDVQEALNTDGTLDVDSMSFEWTENTELFFNSQYGYWIVQLDEGTPKFKTYDILPLDDKEYSEEELSEIELRHFVLTGDTAIAKSEKEIIEKIIVIYFSDNYASMYNTDDELAKQWGLWNIATYTDGEVTYEMTLSEEDEAVHARKIEGGEVTEEYDTETSIKLARKIIKDLIPEVTVE